MKGLLLTLGVLFAGKSIINETSTHQLMTTFIPKLDSRTRNR